MPYEILIRGNPDGTISGAHSVEWIPDGTNADGSPRSRPGDPRPVQTSDLAPIIGEQYAALVAQISDLQAQVLQQRAALDAAADAQG